MTLLVVVGGYLFPNAEDWVIGLGSLGLLIAAGYFLDRYNHAGDNQEGTRSGNRRHETYWFFEDCLKKNGQALKQLEKKPSLAKRRDQDGQTALMAALRAGDEALVDALLDAGADVTAKTKGNVFIYPIAGDLWGPGATTLMMAAMGGSDALFDKIWALGCDPLAVTSRNAYVDEKSAGDNVLMAAAYGMGTPHMVKRLVDAGLDVNYRNAAGDTALHFASMRGNADIIPALLEAGSDTSPVGHYDKTALGISMSPDGSKAAYSALMAHMAKDAKGWDEAKALMDEHGISHSYHEDSRSVPADAVKPEPYFMSGSGGPYGGADYLVLGSFGLSKDVNDWREDNEVGASRFATETEICAELKLPSGRFTPLGRINGGSNIAFDITYSEATTYALNGFGDSDFVVMTGKDINAFLEKLQP